MLDPGTIGFRDPFAGNHHFLRKDLWFPVGFPGKNHARGFLGSHWQVLCMGVAVGNVGMTPDELRPGMEG